MSDWPHVAPPEPVDDPSIPLLTDRIYLKAVELDTALPASLAPGAPSEPAALAEPLQAEGDTPSMYQGPAEPFETAHEAARPDEIEAAIEAELDRELVAASDADFFALLAAEEPQPAAAGEVAAVEAPPAEAPPVEPPPEAPPTTYAEAEQTPPAVAPAIDEAAIEAQAEALRAAVLQRVASRLPEQVNAAVRDLMQPAIDQAMAKLGEEAELALRITLQELVEQALREELARHHDRDTMG